MITGTIAAVAIIAAYALGVRHGIARGLESRAGRRDQEDNW